MKINLLNYESYAIDYLEGNLNPEDALALEQFLMANPQIKQSLEEIAAFELPALTAITYPHKSSLYKKSRKLYLPVLAIAASLLLLLTIGYSWLFNPNTELDPSGDSKMIVEEIQSPNQEPNSHFTEIAEKPIEESIVAAESVRPENQKTAVEHSSRSKIDPPVRSEESREIILKSELTVAENHQPVEETLPLENKTPYINNESNPISDYAQKAPVVVAQLPMSSIDMVVPEQRLEAVALVMYDLEDFNTKSKVALSKRLGFLSDLMQPESFDQRESSTIKEAIVPEAFGNLFSKKTR